MGNMVSNSSSVAVKMLWVQLLRQAPQRRNFRMPHHLGLLEIARKGKRHQLNNTVFPLRAESFAASRMRIAVIFSPSADKSTGATLIVPRTTAAR